MGKQRTRAGFLSCRTYYYALASTTHDHLPTYLYLPARWFILSQALFLIVSLEITSHKHEQKNDQKKMAIQRV